LIKHGAEINAKTNDGNTVLMNAVRGSANAVKIVIDAGADVNATNKEGRTALIEATYYAYLQKADIIDVLIDAGADAMMRDDNGTRAIEYSSRTRDFKDTDTYRRLESASGK
jgi:ankyrin repeat protein